MDEIIMYSGLIGFIFLWFYYGYKGANKMKDGSKYNYFLVLEEDAWTNADDIFYHFCILAGWISYFSINFTSDPDLLKIYNDKILYRSFVNDYLDLGIRYDSEVYLKKSQGYFKRIDRFEKEIENPYYKKYKIDLCDSCNHTCGDHNCFDLCHSFKHIKALD